MTPTSRVFVRQTWALTKKTFLIAVVRHWRSTFLRAVFLPIAFMVLLSNIKNFLIARNGFGVGTPLPVQSLADSFSSTQKLVFVTSPGLGPDVARVVEDLADPLQGRHLVYLTEPNDLLTTCKESLLGHSDCFAAVVFNDSPLTIGKNGIWNYTIRTDSALAGGTFFSSRHNNDQERVYLPFQLAIDNAITNSSLVPNEYLYTSISQGTQDDDIRKTYQGLIISTYGIAFFIGLVPSIYHLVGMVTTERESGMTQLLDAMGCFSVSRICSYILVFDLIYLPCWIVFGIVFWAEVFRTSSILVLIFWQVFTGMAITSASVFTAMFFSRAQLSGIYSTLAFLIVGVIGQIVDRGSASTAVSAILSALFPSMNYMFMIGYIGRYERRDHPTNMLHAATSTSDQSSSSRISGILLWVFLWLQTFIYPVLAMYTEMWIHGTKGKGRQIGIKANEEVSLAAITIAGLTKIYPPTSRQKWFSRGKAHDVIAVNNLNLVAHKGQILCLLGANGSGKTTTLDMIGGLQGLTKGSIDIHAAPSQLGICPQRNVLWDELTVEEHITIWNEIKYSQDDRAAVEHLVEACDLTAKRTARSGTLSGGQKRKLQLACMFVGGSTVCLLDEVSSGLDPLSRRVIWNIILAERSKRTMILTTHFLDEADVLADHVAIISLGLLKCEGSVVELKNRLGGGYKVHLPGTSNGPKVDFPTKRLCHQTVYNTPSSAEAARLMSTLESLGYGDILVNGPTVEDVFLCVAQEPHAARIEQQGDEDDSLEPKDGDLASAISRAVSRSNMKLSTGQDTSFLYQSQVLFRKRFTVLLRNWLPHIIAFLIPIAVTPALQSLLKTYKAPLCSGVSFVDFHQAQPLNIRYVSDQIGNYQLLAGPMSINQSLYNVVSQFPIGEGLNISNYTNQFIFENTLPEFQQHIATLYTNVTPGALFMDSNSTTPTYAYLGDFGVLPSMLIQNLWTQVRTGMPIALYYTQFDSLLSNAPGNAFQYIVYFCLAQAVYPAFFALYPTYERLRKVRALQYSNGVRPLPLWFSYALFDFIFVIVTAAVCTIVVSQQANWWFGAGYLFPVLALYGLAAILFVYVVSLFASSQLGAFAFAAGGQAVMFLVTLLAFIVSETYAPSNNVQHVIDAITFGLNIVFPIGNVVRSLTVGFNIFLVNCRDNKYISSPGSTYAYGGPILYLCIQVLFLFWFILWLESQGIPSLSRRKYNDNPTEHELRPIPRDVMAETERVESSDSDHLRVLHLTKRFGSNVAVDNISFGVSPSEVFALLGPNGAGKSTAIDMIRGELRPDHGNILLEGTDIVRNMRAARSYLGVCPQFDALDLMTTREHLQFYARCKGITTVEQDVDTLLSKVGLEAYESRLAYKLSGGNKRKLSLAIALIGNPTLLVLDEPSSSMDAASKRIMWKTLAEVASGRSVILTTHSMEEADALATRAGIISRRFLALGTTDSLRKQHGNVYHIHLVLKSAPTSSEEEIERITQWIERSFAGARFDSSFGSYHGQIKFSVPASTASIQEEVQGAVTDDEDVIRSASETRNPKISGVRALFSFLEEHKDEVGLDFYSVGGTTLDQVFLNVVTANNVAEEGYEAAYHQGKRGRKKWWF